MSHTEYKLSLSKKAQEDFEDILLYTIEVWGEEQMYVYRDDILNTALEELQKQPHIGHARPDLSDQHRAFIAGRHVIVYQLIDKNVFVSRILHSRMDFVQRLSEG